MNTEKHRRFPRTTSLGPLVALLFLFAISLSTLVRAQNTAPRPAVSKAQAMILVRTALIALNHANLTGNYTVLRELASPSFQAANTAANLAQAFASLRKRKLDLSPIAIVAPRFQRPPFINRQGMLVLIGHFPTRPVAIHFALGYSNVRGFWRLNYIQVVPKKAAQGIMPARNAQRKKNLAKARKMAGKKKAAKGPIRRDGKEDLKASGKKKTGRRK